MGSGPQKVIDTFKSPVICLVRSREVSQGRTIMLKTIKPWTATANALGTAEETGEQPKQAIH